MYPKFMILRIVLPDGTRSQNLVVLTTPKHAEAFDERVGVLRTELDKEGGSVETEETEETPFLRDIVNGSTCFKLSYLSRNLN